MTNVVVEDIQYRIVDGVALLGRLYRPASGVEVGVLLIDVHGGAWTQNDRLNNASMHHYLAEQGIAVFALDFRMAPAYRYPAAMQDINFGIRWTKANLALLGLGPGQGMASLLIGGLGTSSGGHLMTLNALRPDDADFSDKDVSDVRDVTDVTDVCLAGHDAGLDFVITCWPILDPLARYRMAQVKGIKNLVDAHDAFWPDEAAMHRGNPQLVLERGEATCLPPMLILQGTADENVEHQRADAFAAAYIKAGGVVEIKKFPQQPHAFITKNPDSGAASEALAEIKNYIEARRTGV
jgi:acetyl esterase